MDALQLLRIQAHANALANHRLHGAMALLPVDVLNAPRIGFFPSLMATLNHVLAVDLYYVGALHGDADPASAWTGFVAPTGLSGPDGWADRQRRSDARLVGWFDGRTATDLAREVAMPRQGGRVQRDLAGHVLAHLFMHQTHHRGQVHAMLSGTEAVPPQLDEFLMPSEAHLRSAEMAALGWSEATVYGG